MTEVHLHFEVRAPFLPYIERTQRWASIVAHRRCGKTVACIMDLIERAGNSTASEARYAYIAPFYSQAKDVAWSYLKRYVTDIPEIDMRESELSVTFPHNEARIRLYGADNYDRLRGLYLDGAVIDESANIDPRAWPEVIRPALSDRRGWATFIGTPAGRNSFYDLHTKAEADPSWFTAVLKASQTGLIADDELADARRSMSAEQYAREYECSFDAAVDGAYYATYLEAAAKEGRISRVAADPLMTKRAFWDIGGSGARADATAIWIAQFVGREIRVLDYYESVGQPLAAHIGWLRERGYEKALCVLPHDGASAERAAMGTYESLLNEAGFETEVIPNQGAGAARQRIEMVRRLFPSLWINEATTGPGREAIAWYHEKRDPIRHVGLGPDHDWSCHAADALGLMCVAYEQPKTSIKPTVRKQNWVV